MGGFTDFLNETSPQEEVKKSAFLGFLDTFTGAANAALRENMKLLPEPIKEGEYVDYTAPKPKEPPLTIISHGIPTGEMSRERAMKTGGGLTQFASGLVPGMKQAMGLLAPVPEPETAEERVMGWAGKFTGLLGAPSFVGGKVAGLATKVVAKVLGGKLAPTIAGEAIQLGVSRGVSLGTAGVLNDLDTIKSGKEALDTFKTYAIMGEIFGLAGMAHLPKHPVLSQIIRQVGGRVLLGNKITPESLSQENIGQTTFNELLNTFFLAHGESPAKVFAGGIAHGRAVRFIEGMEEKPTPAEVRAAGGPAKWLGKALTDLVDAAKPVAEMAKSETPDVLYSKEKPKEELPGMIEAPAVIEQHPSPRPGPGERWTSDRGAIPGEPAYTLDGDARNGKAAILELERGNKVLFEAVIPGGDSLGRFQTLTDAARAAEAYVNAHPERPEFALKNEPEKPAPFLPGATEGRQGVLPMPDAAPLFAGTEVPSHAGEGGWSPEALKRPLSFFIYDTRTQQTRPLIGIDAVDVQPQIGEVKYQKNNVTGKTEVADAGPMTNLAVARQQLQEKLRAAGRPDVLFSQELDIHPEDRARLDKDFTGRMSAAHDRAAERRGQGIPEARKKTGAAFTKGGEKEYYERQAVDEAVAAIKEGLTTYDALDPAYYPVLEKHLDAATLYEVSGGRAGQPKGLLVMPENPPARPVAGQTVTPPSLTTGKTGAEAGFVPETAVPAPPARGVAPKTLPELQAEIVRINEGRVSTEQAAALGALVRGVARYKGLTPDDYVAGRFAELESAPTPPEKPFFGRESTAEYVRQLNARGITDPKMVEKILNGEPIASVEFLADGKAVIRAFRKSNIAGMAHELGHVFRRDLSPAELSLVNKACRVQNGKWDRYSEERWASQFELYLKRGKAPNPELEGVFKKFKDWLGAIYQDMKSAFGAKARIHPNVTTVLDKVLGGVERTPTEAGSPRPTEAVGRVTKTAGTQVMPAETLPTGPTIGGDAPSPVNPVLKTLGPPGEPPPPGAAGITRSVVEELKAQPKPPVWGVIKRAIRNPIYLFEKVPVLKKYIRDVDVDAHDNIIVAAKERRAVRAGWEKLIDKASRLRVWNYAVGQQAGGPETLGAMGLPVVRSLTPNETRVYSEIRQNLEQVHGRINEARTLLGLKPIGKIKDYFTFLRKGEEMEKMGHDLINDPDAAFLTEHLNKPTDPSFFKQRRLSKKPLESNLFGIYEHYMSRATKYIEKAPVWANSKLLLETIEYKGPDGKTQTYSWEKENPEWSNDIKKYVEFTIGQKAPSALEYHFGEHGRKAASAINRNLAAAVLSANVRSALIQPTALRNSYIELGRKWLFEGVKRGAFSPSGYKEAVRLSRVLRGRVFDVHQAMLADGERSLAWATAGEIKRKIANVGIAPLKFLDANAAVITWHGAYARATASVERGGLGLSGKKAVLHADDVVTKTQASGAPHDISPIQRTPEGKLASIFQTFVINEWNYLAESGIVKKNESVSNSERYARMFRLVVGTAIVNVIMEDVLKMRSPFPTPERAIVAGIRGGEKFGKIVVDVAREIGEQGPLVGGAIRWTTPSRVALPATAQLGYDIGKLGAKGLNALSEHDLSKMSVADLAVLGQMFGVPGTSQALKTLRRREQGGTWKQSILGQKMETLGTGAAGLTKADKALLDKYGLGKGASKSAPKKNQKALDDLLKKYGVKK